MPSIQNILATGKWGKLKFKFEFDLNSAFNLQLAYWGFKVELTHCHGHYLSGRALSEPMPTQGGGHGTQHIDPAFNAD
jgi:hypothetical protein